MSPQHAQPACNRLTARSCMIMSHQPDKSVPPAAAEPGYSELFVANSTGVSFYINTTHGSFNEAEENCQFNGGHVATYTSVTEQVRRRPMIIASAIYDHRPARDRFWPAPAADSCCAYRCRLKSRTTPLAMATSSLSVIRATGWATRRSSGASGCRWTPLSPATAPAPTGTLGALQSRSPTAKKSQSSAQ
jgi:hypothetical protein